MQFSNALIAAAATYFAVGANAHMKLATPAPYGDASLNNSPLAGDGSDFPCKQRPDVYGPAKSTATMPIGAKQTLAFIGGATHSGGSCQISITSDEKPTKDSNFKVIHSIEGGCPSAAQGNLGNDAAAALPSNFEYSVPAGFAPGKYTLAWTWFNRGGNREMYMNCAPIIVTDGANKARDLDDEPAYNSSAAFELAARDVDLPDMFVANIGSVGGGCSTAEGTDLQFPQPGNSVQKGGDGHYGPPTGSCAVNKAAAGGSGASPSAAAVAPSAAESAAAPVASAPIATILASPSAAAVPAPSAAPAAAAPSSAPAAGAASNGSTTSSGSCTPGQLVCSADGTKFGLCNGGTALMQPVAAGTKCVNGAIAHANAKRSAKFARQFNA